MIEMQTYCTKFIEDSMSNPTVVTLVSLVDLLGPMIIV